MKKNLLKTLAAFTLCSTVAISQPILTATGINPVVGDLYTLKMGNYVSPGASGANQTWDLTGINTSNTINYTSQSPSATPYASSFTTSNFSMNNGSGIYAFMNTSATALQNTGAYAQNVTFSYSNPEDMLHFPFNMSNTFTDTWACNFTNGGVSFVRTGTTTVTYDAYGTLAIPTGTFTNVTRIHFYQAYNDVYSGGTINYTNDEYQWYLNGTHQALAGVYTFNNDVSGQSQVGFYSHAGPVSVNEHHNIASGIRMYPNPATDELNVTLNGNVKLKEVQIYDMTGRLKLTETINGLDANDHLTVKLADFSAGIYLVKFISVDGAVGTKKITVNQ